VVRSRRHWLGDPTLAMVSVIKANVWREFRLGLSLLAAMQTVPRSVRRRRGGWRRRMAQLAQITHARIKGVVAW